MKICAFISACCCNGVRKNLLYTSVATIRSLRETFAVKTRHYFYSSCSDIFTGVSTTTMLEFMGFAADLFNGVTPCKTRPDQCITRLHMRIPLIRDFFPSGAYQILPRPSSSRLQSRVMLRLRVSVNACLMST